MFKTDQSKALYERARQSLATGVSTIFRRNVTAVPLYIEKGVGPYYYDADGNELLDYVLAWGPLILGNNHPALKAAIAKQLDHGFTYGFQHKGEIELAELMCKSIPGVERVIFSNTGSEAVQSALRLARAFTGRKKIVKFEGHYHGWMNNVLVSNSPPPEKFGQTIASTGGQPEEEFSLTITAPWNDLPALEKILDQHKGQIAAVLTEPILINNGSCMPGDGFLQGVIHLCRKHGTVSIFDEVITGFRLALGGAREYFKVQPDLSVYAKAMAGGFSMSAVGGRKDIFDVLETGKTSHAGTYNGNPIAVAAAIATITTLSEPGTYERMHKHGYAVRQALEEAGKAAGHTLVTSGVGTAFHLHFGLTEPPRSYRDYIKADQQKNTRFRAIMLEHGVLLMPGGRWYVGWSHTDKELEKVVPAIQASMKAL